MEFTLSVDPRNDSATTVFTSTGSERRPNVIRDALAAVLLVLGLLLPWNIECAARTIGWVLGLLALVSMSAFAALVLGHYGPQRGQRGADRLRLLLSVPYFVVAAGFVGFTIVQTVRYGGTGSVPPGVGPGAWLGTAGALLAAQPMITSADDGGRRSGARVCRLLGIASLVLAVAAVLFNLYWRTRFVIPNIGNADTGMQNLVVAVAAVLYGVVALAPIVIAARWLMSDERTTRLATVLLGASTVIAGAAVWILPVGRDLDAFHGIAQNTSTAGVGFEGYFVWVAAAALGGTAVVIEARRGAADDWRGAARKCLLLIAVWCAGSAVLRIVDLMSVSVLDLPAPPYTSTALMAFDLVVAVLALWLYVNHRAESAISRSVLPLLFGALFVLTVSRVILGVALIPRVQPLNATDINAVYGNTLAQQITGSFDVVLCVLAFALLAIPVVVGARATRSAVVPTESDIAVDSGVPELAAVVVDTATMRIARPKPESAVAGPAHDRVAEVLAESTRRFAAGTTYGGAEASGGGRDRH
jgi:hypothetical protein